MIDQFEVVEISKIRNRWILLLGDYIMRYQAIDSNDNEVITDRQITVIDTIPPQVALVTHDFFDGTPLVTYNTEDFNDRQLLMPKYPIPKSIFKASCNQFPVNLHGGEKHLVITHCSYLVRPQPK